MELTGYALGESSAGDALARARAILAEESLWGFLGRTVAGRRWVLLERDLGEPVPSASAAVRSRSGQCELDPHLYSRCAPKLTSSPSGWRSTPCSGASEPGSTAGSSIELCRLGAGAMA